MSARLCRRFGIGRTCGPQLIARYRAEGEDGLAERSRRPRSSPRRSAAGDRGGGRSRLRAAHPAWGGRKIARVLASEGIGTPVALDDDRHPAPQRHRLGLAGGGAKPSRASSTKPQRSVADGLQGPCRHARRPAASADRARRSFALLDRAGGLRRPDRPKPCKRRLIAAFRRYGLPRAHHHRQRLAVGRLAAAHFTPLGVCLIDHGIARHPFAALSSADDGQGRTLPPHAQGRSAAGPPFADLAKAPRRLRPLASCLQPERPHDALAGAVRSIATRPPRQYRDTVEPFDYAPDDPSAAFSRRASSPSSADHPLVQGLRRQIRRPPVRPQHTASATHGFDFLMSEAGSKTPSVRSAGRRRILPAKALQILMERPKGRSSPSAGCGGR